MRSGPRLLAAVLLALAAAGPGACVHYRPRPISPADTLAEFTRRSLTDAGLLEFLSSNGEPVPEQKGPWGPRALTLVAFFYHPDLDLARAELAVAEAGAVTAGARENPAVALSVGTNSTTPASLVSPWILGFNLDVPLATARKRAIRTIAARELAGAARLRLAAAAWQARSGVRAALVELDAATRSEALLQEQETAETANVRLLERQLEAGVVSPYEPAQARLALAAATISRQDAAARRLAARGRLADALGLPADALAGVSFSFEGLTGGAGEVPTPEARRQAVLNRTDVLGALAEYAAAQADLRLEIARQYPDIHLGPGYEFDQGDNKWFLALSLPLPLVNSNRGPIAEADARRTAAAARFVAVQAHAFAEVDQAVAAYDAAQKNSVAAERTGADLERQERAAQARFEAGDISRLEVGTARVERISAELARLDARTKAQAAFGRLEDAIQGPLGVPPASWQNDPRPPNTSGNKEQP